MPAPDDHSPAGRSGSLVGRPYLCILFECCHVYTRVYRRPEEMLYTARCPKCLRAARIQVAPHGQTQRFFVAR